MKIVWVGAGALGSYGILFTRNVEGLVKVIDFDVVEKKNLDSQNYTRRDVGKGKAISTSRNLMGNYSKQATGTPTKLDESNVEALLSGADLVVDAVDNVKTRRAIQAFVRANNVPCVHGALSAGGVFGVVMWDDVFEPDAESEEGAPTCEDGDHLAFITLVSSVLARAITEFARSGVRNSYYISPHKVTRVQSA